MEPDFTALAEDTFVAPIHDNVLRFLFGFH